MFSAGYFCSDHNMALGKDPQKCIDMKLRFCCIKKMRAHWSKWQNWSECSASCGGGTRTRKKSCKQAKKGAKNPNYIAECVGENDPAK